MRNPGAHGRTLFAHEYVEAEGIARRLRTGIGSLWRARMNVQDEYWPFIEAAEDSLGHRITTPGPSVRVKCGVITEGELVQLRCVAFDPKGRDLTYRMRAQTSAAAPLMSSPWGNSSEFEWVAGPPGRSVVVQIEARAGDGAHAFGEVDALASFQYDVRPKTSLG
ncbi:MAG: hypothetical protein M3P18_19135 [Actinomycetota bacterium]|nr:hypothetical protein [Actinomycetota bacterium]